MLSKDQMRYLSGNLTVPKMTLIAGKSNLKPKSNVKKETQSAGGI
jgi:hypothetical protein